MHTENPKPKSWSDSSRRRLAQRALERQLQYQEHKARLVPEREAEIVSSMQRRSKRVRDLLQSFKPFDNDARVIEVGSGSNGLIFYFGARGGIGVDPLAVSYSHLFPVWQRRAATIAALGECLPFADNTFDVVLCDNVVDHAESPTTIVGELIRILKPAGLLYFTVNVHHALYSVAAQIHSTWRAVGVPFEVGPFADHTTHLTPSAAENLFRNVRIKVLSQKTNVLEAKVRSRQVPPRHLGDRLKRVFYKNALFELVAEKAEEGSYAADLRR